MVCLLPVLVTGGDEITCGLSHTVLVTCGEITCGLSPTVLVTGDEITCGLSPTSLSHRW